MPPSMQTPFAFINTTAEDNPFSLRQCQKRQVRRHAARNRAGRPKVHQPLAPWLHQQCNEPTKSKQEQNAISKPPQSGSAPLPRSLGLLQLPSYVESNIIHSALPFFQMAQERYYPRELCSILNASDSTWLALMIGDPVYFNAVAFSIQGYSEATLGGHLTAKPLLHLSKTLHLLRQRLDSPASPGVTTDSTLMTVVLLALVSEDIEPGVNIASHLTGLDKLVSLRGGISRVRSQSEELWTKVCRIDIIVAIRYGARPKFFRDIGSGSPCLGENQLQGRRPDTSAGKLVHYISAQNTQLGNIWLDLKVFCDMANLAQESGDKMRAEDFAKSTLSLLYRLLHLSCRTNVVQETLRLGMLAYIAAVYLGENNTGIGQRRHLMHLFTCCLSQLEAVMSTVPTPLGFWLLFVWRTLSRPQDRAAHLDAWLARLAEQLKIKCWEEAQVRLKAALWINVLHDHMGKRAFDYLRPAT